MTKSLRSFSVLLGCATAILLSGCAVAVRPPVIVGGPVVVAPAPVDWWYDGANYYFYDAGAGMYFYYGFDGAVIWCASGWYPHSEWLRIGHPVYFPEWHGGHPVFRGGDGGWHGGRGDGGWHGGHDGGFHGGGHGGFHGGRH